ncbi:glycoside hydrolase [Pyricularia oryzae 70-15]|uniref:alpha-glucosidase n=3 Tax=Pyricularia oryzae TaxID=318829 RepID=G4MNN7_PYRO7|nr:glycoside hydrolase [Pyricularia oryzae 70-15]EHA56253.1 glycoside hydrolase [Pyricularia oryzae 70-15]
MTQITMATDEELIMTPPESPPTPLRRGSIIGGRQGDKFRLTVLADGLVRYEWAPDSRFEDRPSSFAYRRDRGGTDGFVVEESDDGGWIDIVTKRFRITFDTNCTSFAAHNFFCLVAGHTRSLWRYGYYKPWESLGGTARTLDRVDGRTDWGTGIMSHKGYATIDDSTTMLFEEDGFVAPRLAGEGRVDGYLFAYGHDYRDAIKAFYLISGETPVIPRWALGNWWSRYYPYSDDEYVGLMDDFEKHRVPLSVAVIDMDWHLVDDPRVIADGQNGWTGYSWDRKLFPHPRRFLAELHKRGLKTTLNDHPADGVHRYEDLYEEFCRAVGRDPASGEPVAFDITNRKYMRAYFEVLLKPLQEDGCDFWWIDWQQGEYTKLRGVDPLWVLNHFHYQHIKSSKMPQPLILSRYAGPGSHRYPLGFSGDSVVSWDSLRFQPAFTATASNIGYGWWSHDIGGHYLGAKSVELTTRWVQLGVFSPIMRLHSSNTRWVSKEPWLLPTGGPQETVLDFMRLRHRLLPYLYSMNVRASEEGMPLVQPMYWECPTRHEAYRVENQFLFGSSMMVLPITDPLDPTYRLAKTKGWLPPGRWVDYFTGRIYTGDREAWMSRPLDQYPVFVREGSIVVLDAAEKLQNSTPLPSSLEVVLAVDQSSGNACFDLHEDVQAKDGEIRRLTTKIEWTAETSTVTITNPPGSPKDSHPTREWNLLFLAQHGSRCTLTNAQNNAQLRRQPDERGSRFTLGSFPSDEPIVVTLGGAGGMRNKNPIGHIEKMLGDAEIEYALKDTIWAALTVEMGKKTYQARPKNEQLQGVQALEIDDSLRHAIVELLLLEYEDI